MEGEFSSEERKYIPQDRFDKHIRGEENKIMDLFPVGPEREILFDVSQFQQPFDVPMGSRWEDLVAKYAESFATRIRALEKTADREKVLDAMVGLYDICKERWEYEITDLYRPAQTGLTMEEYVARAAGAPPSETHFTGGWLMPHILKKFGRHVEEWTGPQSGGKHYRSIV